MTSPTPPTASAARRSSNSDSPYAPPAGEGHDTSNGKLPVNRYVVFFSLAAIGCAVDLWTKHVMFAWRGLPPNWRGEFVGNREIHWLIDGYFGIETALNQGALFGMGQGKVWLFALLSFLAIAGITYWLFVAKAARDAFLNFALGLVMGGILGNLYDRLGLWRGVDPQGETIYAVRDWILISYGGAKLPLLGADWPNFNIADSLLVCGAILLVWHSFRSPREVKSDKSPKVEGES